MGADTDRKLLESMTEDERRWLQLMNLLWQRHHMTLPEILDGVMKQHNDNLLHGVQQIVEKHETTKNKRLHNIFAWIASQFKT